MTENELKKLLSEMTLAEKIGELNQMPGEFYKGDIHATGENKTTSFSEETIRNVGSAINVQDPDFIIEVQKKHIENHPHHIPMLFMLDIIHGYHTTFPIPLAQGCSFEPKLVEELASAAAKEGCVSGIHVTFSPMADLVRDARWGRVMESTGEDPYLNRLMAAAAVRGYQGDDLTREGTMSACIKHFSGYGAVEGGREYGTVDISERNLRQYYLPAYKAACDEGCGMLMTAFNAIGGVPATCDKHILRDILRDEWKFEGATITDYGSLSNLGAHGISDDAKELSKLGLEVGVDIEMCIHSYNKGIYELADSGELDMKLLDEAVYRVLNLKNRLGLFENPYRFADSVKAKQIIRSKEILDLAREAIPKSSVLLKNEDKMLPLNTNQKIAFIGPYLYETDMRGGWGGIKYTEQTLESELKTRFDDCDFRYTKGSELIGKEDPGFYFHSDLTGFEDNDELRAQKLEQAVSLAKDADTVVMFIGEHRQMGGELNSRVNITIPEIQQELFDAISRVNKNIAVVLFNHRPLDLRRIVAKSKAILDVWFPGTMGAAAITDMLFGDIAPTGKLSMSFPYQVGQLPIYYNALPTDHPAERENHFVTGYIDCPITPMYSFGEGLTYTSFKYGELKLSKTTISDGQELVASIDVTNIGDRGGTEIVQLYLRDRYATVSRPIKELKGFKRVDIKAGETATVEFTINPDMCRYYNVDLEYVWDKGEIQVFVGKDSTVTEYKSFELI